MLEPGDCFVPAPWLVLFPVEAFPLFRRPDFSLTISFVAPAFFIAPGEVENEAAQKVIFKSHPLSQKEDPYPRSFHFDSNDCFFWIEFVRLVPLDPDTA